MISLIFLYSCSGEKENRSVVFASGESVYLYCKVGDSLQFSRIESDSAGVLELFGNTQDDIPEDICIDDEFEFNDEFAVTEKYPVECDTGSQSDMNYCTWNEYLFYDSIMKVRYITLIGIIDDEIAENTKNKDASERERTLNYKNKILASQEMWKKSCEMTAEVHRLLYEGGTMEPLLQNMQLTAETKERIKTLNFLIDEGAR